MMRAFAAIIASLTAAACMFGGQAEDASSFSFNNAGEFSLSCESNSFGVLQEGQTDAFSAAMRAEASEICGGEFSLVDYESSSKTVTGRESEFSARLEFRCEATDAVLANAEAFKPKSFCDSMFE
ncbi:MAG: hypothetical protein AAGI03_04440 [Pseudomonadota bacterium]